MTTHSLPLANLRVVLQKVTAARDMCACVQDAKLVVAIDELNTGVVALLNRHLVPEQRVTILRNKIGFRLTFSSP